MIYLPVAVAIGLTYLIFRGIQKHYAGVEFVVMLGVSLILGFISYFFILSWGLSRVFHDSEGFGAAVGLYIALCAAVPFGVSFFIGIGWAVHKSSQKKAPDTEDEKNKNVPGPYDV